MRRKLLRRYLTFGLTLFLGFGHSALIAQETNNLKRDSVYIDRGINNTNNFESDRRIYFLTEDDEGRVLDKVIHHKTDDGEFQPFRRHLSTYEGSNLTKFVIQAWELMNQEWVSIREDSYSFDNDLLNLYLRRTIDNGMLTDYRQWKYSYDADGNEVEVILQEMKDGQWVNLSRKQQSFNDNGDLLSQTLQKWVDNAWKNNRQREWEYDMMTNLTRQVTVSAWDTPSNTWIAVVIQTFSYNANRQWTGSSYQAWDQNNQVWVNTQRTQHLYDNQQNPIAQIMQNWESDEWRNNLRSGLVINGEKQAATIQQWDASTDSWTNFLRYQQTITQEGIAQEKLGMEAWDATTGNWINKNFTQRYTYFWSEELVNALRDISLPSHCQIPNPYSAGLPIQCDLTDKNAALQVELFDMMGRKVLQQQWSSTQSSSIDAPPLPGIYVLRVTQNQQIQHLQKIVIQ